MSIQSNKDSEEDEQNRIDFENLLRRSTDRSPASSASSSSPSNSSEIWPLHLNTILIEHYVLGDQIGTGSYGEVRECVDQFTLERCAVKIINKDYLIRQNPRALSNQMQEVKLLKRTRHKNVITLKECLFRSRKIYIVLEHCSFVLQSLLADQDDNKLSVSLSRSLFRQMMNGIHYLHSQGIVHRDIKPQNLLIARCGTLKIIDFGVSQILSIWTQNDQCSNYEGSPLFQAPEVVCGQSQYAGFKVDIWSAGVTLYLMLFGQYPFFDESLLSLYDKILSDDLVIPELIEESKKPGSRRRVLTDLIAALLDKDCERRATSEEVLAHPWLTFQCTTFNCEHNNQQHSEYIDLIHIASDEEIKRRDMQPGDIYKSMTVLPYLHNLHFPNLPARKVRPSNTPSSTETTPTTSPHVDPHLMIEDRPIEWGTERQYQLLRLPQVRVNRLRLPSRRNRQAKRA